MKFFIRNFKTVINLPIIQNKTKRMLIRKAFIIWDYYKSNKNM